LSACPIRGSSSSPDLRLAASTAGSCVLCGHRRHRQGRQRGEGLGNQFLANIREAEAIAQVVRVFDDPDVIHVDGKVDPRSDMETINTELILADLQTIEKAIPRIEKEVKIKKREAAELNAILAAQKVLERGDTIFSSIKSDKLEMEHLKELSLLTAKPFIYVFNADEESSAARRSRPNCAPSWRRPTASSSMPSSKPTSWNWTRKKRAKCWK
jgi:ribosome-binding ATPase YchF (GTP1/OBG family)